LWVLIEAAGGPSRRADCGLSKPPSRTSRALIVVMENYQEPDGSIALLEVLRPYMGGRTRIEATR
jgi:hypothetical protein